MAAEVSLGVNYPASSSLLNLPPLRYCAHLPAPG